LSLTWTQGAYGLVLPEIVNTNSPDAKEETFNLVFQAAEHCSSFFVVCSGERFCDKS
jgi:hypothetical protein